MPTLSELRKQGGLTKELEQRTQESYARKEERGGVGDFFKSDAKLPRWFPDLKKTHICDFIPFQIGELAAKLINAKGEPIFKGGVGQVAYVLPLWVHRRIGQNEANYVCPNKNFGLPCPICEDWKAQTESGTLTDREYKKLRQKLFPSRRAVYNVWVADTEKEAQEGVKVWEVASYFVEDKLDELARKKRGGGVVIFSDPDVGKSISFKINSGTATDDEGKTIKTVEYEALQFEDRDYTIPDTILDAAYQLDAYIVVLPYEDLYEIHFGEPVPPKGTSRVQQSSEEQPSARLRGRKPPEEKPVEEKPVPEEVKQPVKETSTSDESGCTSPMGNFGVDCGKLITCPECVKFDLCADEKKRLDAEKPAETSAPEPEPETEKPAEKPTGRRFGRKN